MKRLEKIDINPETFLREHCTLPALPAHILELQQALESEDTSLSKVAALVSRDPSLVAQVLKIVNSAYFGIPREVSDLHLAVGFLGIHEIYRIAISFAVIDTIKSGKDSLFEQLWHHSLYTALISKYLKHIYEPLISEGELWISSILHDIGKLVYLKFFPDHIQAAVQLARKKGILYREAETLLEIPSHSQFGSVLCDRWRLPLIVKKTIQANADVDIDSYQEKTAARPLTRLVIVANLMAVLSRNNLSHDKKIRLKEIICTELGCDESNFLVIMGEIYDLKEQIDTFI